MLAGPLPEPRPGASATGFRAGPVGSTPLDRACGTNLDGVTRAYTEFAERAALSATGPLPAPNSTDAGEIAVLEDDGTFFFTDKNGNANLDLAAAGRAFYRTHGDDYDEIELWLASGLTNWLGSSTALAAAWLVKNPISGIGLSLFDYNPYLGLPPRVRTVLTMNGLQKYPDDQTTQVPGLANYNTQDVVAHEFAHQWLSFVQVQGPSGPSNALLGRSLQHWSFFFDDQGSVMDGSDWLQVAPDSFVALTPIVRYGPLDQYLMGVRSAAEVGSLQVLSDSVQVTPPDPFGPYVPSSESSEGMTAKGASTLYGIQDVIAANGARVPDVSNAPHTLRVAFALIVPRGTTATSSDLAKLENIRTAFPTTVNQNSGGRMSVDVSLDSHLGRLVLQHRKLPDTESPGVPRPVGLRVTVEQAGIPITLDASATKLWWRIAPATTWNAIAMSSAGPDSFAAVLPGSASGQTLEYWFSAQANVPSVQGVLPDLAHSAPFSYRTGPDVTPPAIIHWEQPAQALERLPQQLLARVTDNLGVDTVWCEYSRDGLPIQMLGATHVNGDSFLVSIGSGAVRGSKLAYRFGARDRALVPNVGYSRPGYDTLRVGYDLLDGFWNPGPWTHGIVRFNRRDEWKLVEKPASPSGSAAWHCGDDSIPYGPYQDAAVTSTWIPYVTPGTYLTFTHKFDLEEGSPTAAYDAVRVEVMPSGGVWDAVTPLSGYTHMMAEPDQGFPMGGPCWSGKRDDWHEERIDLSAYAPGPIRVRFHVSTDLFVGGGGWWVDQVQVHYPTEPTTGVTPPPGAGVSLGPLFPNPAPGSLQQSLRLPGTARVDWALYDVAGRRIVTLFAGPLVAGLHELSGTPPRALAGGLYFSRVSVDGLALEARRVAIVR